MDNSSASSRLIALVVVTVLMCPAVALAQVEVASEAIARIRDEGLNRSQVMDHAWYLTDVIGARLSGSSNLRQAQVWAKERMDEFGLVKTAIEPWGEQGANWDVEYVSLHMLEPAYQPVIGFPQAFTPGTDGNVVGRLVIAEILSPDDLEALRGTLEGAIVLSTPPREYGPRFTADAIRHDEGSLDVFVQDGIDRNYQRRKGEIWWQNPPQPNEIDRAEIEAFYKSEGAAAVLVAAKGGDGTVFVTGRQGHRSDRSLASIENSLPTIAVAAEHYGRMYRLVKADIPVRMEIEVRISAEERDLNEYNVIGEIAGTDLNDEVVMIGAHLDSWHSGTGATDNAAGSAVVLEAMRILKAVGVTPRRTIRAALWSSEEGGLKGSRAYVARQFGNPEDSTTSDHDKFSVYFNVDNGTGQFRGIHMQGNEFVAPIFAAWMAPFQDLKVGTLSTFSNRGSDQVAFDEVGLPGFQFIQDRIEYRSRTWHSNMDVYDKLIARDLQINAVVLASFAYQAAMTDDQIPRKPLMNVQPEFSLADEELFGDGLALTNAIADFDNDGDLDIFVGFRGRPNRLYRNNGGEFVDVAGQVGIADNDVTRSAAWGDYDNDGHLDLFVAFVSKDGSSNKLYRNEGDGSGFTDVTSSVGIELTGSFRQASWVDYDRDGDVDLYVGLRDKPNVLFQNNGGRFTDVAGSLGVDDPRRTVGSAWFDFDKDGDLDLIVANMDGDANGLFRNDGNTFVDVAAEAGLSDGGRALGDPTNGSVRPTIVDYDGDGNLDVFMANYGPNGLFRSSGEGGFENVAPEMGLAIDGRYDTGTWGDYDNDGRPDLYVNGTITGGESYRDYLFHNDGERFTDVTPELLLEQEADHGVHWLDFDADGDVDLALTGAAETGMHHLVANSLEDELSQKSLQVLVLDADGHYTLAGSEVRLYNAASGALLGTRMLDTGSGYNSQNAMPVHFGLVGKGPVDIEITTMTPGGRRTAKLTNIDPQTYSGRRLIVRVGDTLEIQ